jgi:hypothetical protein
VITTALTPQEILFIGDVFPNTLYVVTYSAYQQSDPTMAVEVSFTKAEDGITWTAAADNTVVEWQAAQATQ